MLSPKPGWMKLPPLSLRMLVEPSAEALRTGPLSESVSVVNLPEAVLPMTVAAEETSYVQGDAAACTVLPRTSPAVRENNLLTSKLTVTDRMCELGNMNTI